MTDKDRSDPSLLLEVYDSIRARALDRRIILGTFSQAVGREMLTAAPLFPLEAELGIHLAEHVDVEVKARAPQENASSSDNDAALDTFITEMSRLEDRMNFIGYNMLCSQWMLDWGIAWNEYEGRKMVDDLV